MNEESLLYTRIRLLRRRVKLWFLIDGLSRLIIYLLPYLVFAFLVDYFIRDLPAIPRLCFFVGAVIILFLTLFRKVISPFILLNKISDDSFVFLIEKRFPILGERLINLWQLLPILSQQGEKYVGPDSVVSELKNEVVSVSQSYDFSNILSLTNSKKILFTALILLFLSFIACATYPIELNIWRGRLLGNDVKWPKRTTLLVNVIPNYTIAKGQTLSVIAWVDKGPRLSAVYIRSNMSQSETGWQRMILTEKTETENKKRTREFRYDFANAQSSFSFMVKGGDDQTGWLEIQVFDSPILEKITAHYDYPSYTSLSGKTEIGGNIKAPRGTKITINGFSNIKLKDAYWILDSFQQSLTIETENVITESSVITGSFIVDKDTKYSIQLLGTNGLKNIEPIGYSIKSIPDNHPVIKIVEPASEIEYVTPEAMIPLKALIIDDYGISNVKIKVLVNNREGSSTLTENDNKNELLIMPFVITSSLRSSIESTHNLDLTLLNLKEGSSVILNFIATDNCAIPSPQTTTSSDYSLIVVGKAQMEKMIEENLIRLKDDIKKTLQIQESARQTNEIQLAVSSQHRVTQNLNNTTSVLSKITNDINSNKLFSKDISNKLNDVNKSINEIYTNKSPEVTQLLEKISAAKQNKEKDESYRDSASAKQEEIKNDLSEILNSLEEWGDYQDVVSSARELLADTQKALEKMKNLDNNSSASPSDLTELDKDHIINQAKNLQKESENLEKKMARVSEKLKNVQSYYSDKLSHGIQRLKQDSFDENLYSLISFLSSSLMGQAIKTSENVQNTLSSLLDFLEDRVNPEQLKQKLADLTKMIDKVNGLKNKEEGIYDETLKIVDPTGDIAALFQELDSLLLDQKALGEVTGQAMKQEDAKKLADAIKKMAEAQKGLKEQANDLSDQLQNADSKLPQPDSKVEQASQFIQQAADKMSEAAKNMQESSEQSQPSAEGGSKQQPTPPPQPPESKESQAKIAQNQKDALQNLRQARESLQKFLNRQLTEEEKGKLERLARRQKELEEETLKSSGENKESQESLQNAARKMAQAQNNLSKAQSQNAQQDEQEAIEELERLYEFLAQKINNIDQQQKEKTIEELYKMLTEIRDTQISMNNRTADILSRKSEINNRENSMAIEKLSIEQFNLSEECKTVKTKLEEEQSIVFSWTLNSISDDMQLSARLLSVFGENGPADEQKDITLSTEPAYLREIQTDIVRKLKELIDALRNEKNRRKPLQMNEEQMEQMGMKNKLLPLLAELKMLKKMQDNLLSRTELIRQGLTDIQSTDNNSILVQQIVLQRLTAEQGHLAEMTKDIVKRIEELQQKQHP
ncbi:MAG: hypothetical protein V1871_03335 [Planctomycetota bacterium]